MDDDATRFRGSIPAHYDSGLGPVIFRHYADVLGSAVAETRPARILETAAGTGISSAAIVKHNAGSQLVITDLSDEMLELALSKVPPSTGSAVADAQELPFGDAGFDAVACQFGLMFVPDLTRAFCEARRVLAPGACSTSRCGTVTPRTGSPRSWTPCSPRPSRRTRRRSTGCRSG
ncbi:class I SAM-dependent methyltransferase [Leifsonia xyli]|uniref:class I SAM-dependent methyltransferase n=1 Tax=Leifsonia xyli TaxID=1575 RepID=UPI003D666F3F